MKNIEIRLIPKNRLPDIFPLLQECDSGITKKTLQERFEQMCEANYRCVGIYDNNKLIGISGLWILVKYYVGKHIEPDNVYILPEYRMAGIGRRLMTWIEEYAKKEGCRAIELNCYKVNKQGQAFWEQLGYTPLGIHYQKII